MALSVHDQRVDAPPDIVDDRVAGDLDHTRLGIDLDLAYRAAVREDRIVHFVVGNVGDLAVGAEPGALPRQFKKVEAAVVQGGRKSAVRERDLIGASAEQLGGDRLALGDQFRCGLGEQGRGVAHRAAGVRAAAEADNIGVAHDDVDVFDRHGEQRTDDLRETRLVPLPARARPDHDLDPALRRHRDLAALAGRADRGFDIVREPEAEQFSARFRLGPARREAVPIGDPHRQIHVGLVGAAVVASADGIRVWHRLRRDQVHAAQRRPGRCRALRAASSTSRSIA